jgi:hypothetical protein
MLYDDAKHPSMAAVDGGWRMQGNFTKSKVMVFHPKEENPAACRRRTACTWTLGGIAIDQVST